MLITYAKPGTWCNTDPRNTFTNNTAMIVILRPSLTGQLTRTGWGSVDTKHDWTILTNFDDHSFIQADDKWDPSWWWVLAPEGKP